MPENFSEWEKRITKLHDSENIETELINIDEAEELLRSLPSDFWAIHGDITSPNKDGKFVCSHGGHISNLTPERTLELLRMRGYLESKNVRVYHIVERGKRAHLHHLVFVEGRDCEDASRILSQADIRYSIAA